MEIVTNNAFKGEGTLKYKKKGHKVKLTLNAFRIMTSKFGVKLDDFDKAFEEDPLTSLAQLTYCGLLNGALATGKKFEDDFETFCAFFYEDEDGFKQMQELLSAANPTPEEDAEGNA